MSQYIVFENFNPHGLSVKEKLAKTLKAKGYDIVVLGTYATFADYHFHFSSEEVSQISLNYENYMQVWFEGVNLWECCQGSLGYESPSELETRFEKEPHVMRDLYHRFCAIYSFVDDIMSRLEPAEIIVWGGMFLEGQAVKLASDKYNLKCYATEFSFDKERIYFDSCGVIGNRHSFSGNHVQRLPELDESELLQIDTWIENNYSGKDPRQAKNKIPLKRQKELLSNNKHNILIICQCYIDTVISMDCPSFSSSIRAYRKVAEYYSKREDVNLILRLHPGDREEYKEAICKIAQAYENMHISGIEDNIYHLMDLCDGGITINSQAGLEMAVKGKKILALGDCFYSGLGFGLSARDFPNIEMALDQFVVSEYDHRELKRAKTYLYRFLYDYLIGIETLDEDLPVTSYGICNNTYGDTPRVLIVHPSPRYGGSGYYLQELAYQLQKNGAACLILSEGSCPLWDNDVAWRRIKFNGPLVDSFLMQEIADFRPNIIYQVGVRTKPMRVALQCVAAFHAKLIVQAEDDEYLPYLSHYPNPDLSHLEKLDTEEITPKLLSSFLKGFDWNFMYSIFADPHLYRWVDPLMRIICYRIADMHTGIWHSMVERLQKKFNKPIFVIPPFINIEDFQTTAISQSEKSILLKQYKIPESTVIYFVNGTIYDYSDEFSTFLDALVLLKKKTTLPITLVIAGRCRSDIQKKAKLKLHGHCYFRSLGIASDKEYFKMIKAADVICAPGYSDTFNRYRLPSRLVKAMAFEKPVFTFKVGFGEWLKENNAGFVTTMDTAEHWAEVLEETLNVDKRNMIAHNARIFAEKHFDSDIVVKEFYCELLSLLQRPPSKIYLATKGVILHKHKSIASYKYYARAPRMRMALQLCRTLATKLKSAYNRLMPNG